MIASLYIHTLTVTRRTRVSDGQGGWPEQWATVATIQGRLRPANAAERTVADQERAEVTHVLYTATTANIQRGDRVTGAGTTVEVLAVREPSHAGHHYEIDCQEVQEGT